MKKIWTIEDKYKIDTKQMRKYENKHFLRTETKDDLFIETLYNVQLYWYIDIYSKNAHSSTKWAYTQGEGAKYNKDEKLNMFHFGLFHATAEW